MYALKISDVYYENKSLLNAPNVLKKKQTLEVLLRQRTKDLHLYSHPSHRHPVTLPKQYWDQKWNFPHQIRDERKDLWQKQIHQIL